jgi:hypothetical protein
VGWVGVWGVWAGPGLVWMGRRAGLQQCKSFVEMCIVSCLMISGFYWYTADGQILDAHQDKKGALAISPPIVLLAGKHGVSHNGLILPTDVAVVWIVSEAPLAPFVVLLPV